jgi:hypothetical protein
VLLNARHQHGWFRTLADEAQIEAARVARQDSGKLLEFVGGLRRQRSLRREPRQGIDGAVRL